MKAQEIKGAFGIENLTLVERSDPKPNPGQVLVRVRAASINYRDFLVVTGAYNPKQPLPLIPFSDGVGEVLEVGNDVSRAKVGDRVIPTFAPQWIAGTLTRDRARTTLGGPLDGTLAELMVLDEEAFVHAPAHLSDVEAAALPCAALTAWSALVTQGGVKAGDTVLVQGTGGVAIFALQIATLFGAEVIVTSSSDEKLERARQLGAHHTINYRTEPKWGRRVMELTDGRGADHIIEVGGAGTLEQSLRAIKFGGHVSLIGILSGASSPLNILPIVMQNVRVQGVLVGHREAFQDMTRAFSAHGVHPVMDRTFAFGDVQDALRHMEAGRHFGKIGIEFG